VTIAGKLIPSSRSFLSPQLQFPMGPRFVQNVAPGSGPTPGVGVGDQGAAVNTRGSGRSARWLDDLDLLGYPLSAGDVMFCADYGASGYHALRCAARIAQVNHRKLRIVRVLRDVDWLLDTRPLDELLAVDTRRNQAVLDDMIALARSISPGIDLGSRLIRGSVYSILVDESATAGLLVLGSGRDDQPGAHCLPVTSVGHWCLHHAACPVLVVGAGGRVEASRSSSPAPDGRPNSSR
jgi:nucleotide-binding universal stress UspA family protein